MVENKDIENMVANMLCVVYSVSFDYIAASLDDVKTNLLV